jgi:hypothetical protein
MDSIIQRQMWITCMSPENKTRKEDKRKMAEEKDAWTISM